MRNENGSRPAGARSRCALETASRPAVLAVLALAAALASPAQAQLVINEILQDPAAVSDSAGEWLELYNPTGSPVDVEGWTLRDDGTNSHTIANGAPLVVPPGGYLVLARNADPSTNGGVAVGYEYSSFALSNADDEVILLDGGGAEVDRVEYDGGPAFPSAAGKSMEFARDPGLDNNLGSNWCEGYLLFGTGDRGTPGEANHCCLSVACAYTGVDVATRETLRDTLHRAIDDHVRFPYTSSAPDTWDILEMADEDPADATRVLDLYRNASYPKAGGGSPDFDREHSWPKSYGFPDESGLGASPYTDCHHLFLADKSYNEVGRKNNPYRGCASPACEEWPTEVNHGQGGAGQSNWKLGEGPDGTWETWIGRRGDVARAIFYMDVRYEGGVHGATAAAEPDLIVTDDPADVAVTGGNADVAYMGILNDLLAWHEQDPVDDLEIWRNEVVFEFQRNRNPFIDHPEWVRCLYVEDCGGILFADGFESGDTSAWL